MSRPSCPRDEPSRPLTRPGCADLLQVLSILTMERPVSFSSEDIRDEKVRGRPPTLLSARADKSGFGLVGQGPAVHPADQA